jgi:uncharacterized membrane protein
MISRKRHVAKTLTWRVVATSTTVVIAWSVTGDWRVGLGVGGIEVPTKMLLYYLHERFWYNFVGLGVGGGPEQ